MRKGHGIAFVVAAAVVGIVAVVSRRPEPSVEDHLRAYYAAERNSHLVSGGIGVPRVRDRLARHWYKWRGKGRIEFLNEMAKHQSALEDLGYLETRLFVCTNRPALDVAARVRYDPSLATRPNSLNGLAHIWASGATNGVWVMAPAPDIPQWEEWIRKADVPNQMTND